MLRPVSRISHGGRVLAADHVDNTPRWREGDRLEAVFEQRCDEIPDRIAVELEDGSLTFAELDARANQLARHLRRRYDVGPGKRIALLLERAIDSYVAMLAVLKLRAAYVPLDPSFPPDRCAFVVEDAGATLTITGSQLDQEAELIAAQPSGRLAPDEVGDPVDELAYVIYTSGTTGRPKGVAVSHASIVNFVRVAAELYGYQPDDRVYQGLTTAFDFAVEEIWVPWVAGATLVPKPGPTSLLGLELQAFLRDRRITALCCVPTLLATLEEDLPELRLLIVSGEACPQDLVERWSAPTRRFLNVYGPTEATVTATWTVLERGRAVTIGVPLPTYSIVILDPDANEARPLSQVGEIGIAGIGVTDGYLNRPQNTATAFVPDFLKLQNNPSGRIYRTGDLGRVNPHGELEHLGRIDTQVKIRGYRIELDEVEAVLRDAPGVAEAVVSTYQPQPGVDELVGYYLLDGKGPIDEAAVYALLLEKLPSYMVPSFLEEVERLPLMPSGKLDRAALPEPSGPRRAAIQRPHVAARTETELVMAATLGKVLDLDEVSIEAHFFEELGASSLLMARFIAELRRARPESPTVSIRDVYAHPTIRGLAAAVDEDVATDVPAFEDPAQPEPVGTPHYFLCGLLQALTFIAYASLAAVALDAASSWLVAGHGALSLYLRAVAIGAALVVGIGIFPIIVKWLLIGRFKPQRIRVWSLPYVRFWIVKTLVIANPAARLLRGTLFYRYYLLALGARIGRGTLIITPHTPVCTDLISVGSGSVIRNETYFNGYRARDGVIEIGPVSVGDDAFVGELTTLDIYSSVQDGATIGHVSSLQPGQVVPAGETWHGSPARPAPADYHYRTVPSLPLSRNRRIGFNAAILMFAMLVLAPLEAALVSLILTHPNFIVKFSLLSALWIAAALMFGLLGLSLIVVGIVPRLLSRLLQPGRVYPLFGFHHELLRIIIRVSNIPFLTHLFGDSVLIVGYLRYLGWRLKAVVHTGSNFGIDVKQEIPSLSQMGTGTIVSDGLSMLNAEFSATAFRVMPVTIGENCFLGNRLAWPSGARTADNLLLGTGTMVPVGGPVRENTGLLGSPCFEIPRAVEGDELFAELMREPTRRRLIRAKTRHNLVTMALFLLSRYLFELAVLIIAFAPLGGWFGTSGSGLLDAFLLPIAVLGLAEIATGARRLRPRFCPILDRQFWRHERFWKVKSDRYLHVFDGTPFKSLVWRAFGVRVGKRLFDDGASIIEQSLASIGDDVTLNMASELQSHSLENGVFKSGPIVIGDRCTLGVAALINYEAKMGPGSILETDSFLMKGSDVPAAARWRGNPAEEVREAAQRSRRAISYSA